MASFLNLINNAGQKISFFLLLLASITHDVTASHHTVSVKRDITVPYFDNVPMVCDDISLNLTSRHQTVNHQVKSISWILPDGTTITKDSLHKPNAHRPKYVFSSPKEDVPQPQADAFASYNLTVLNVDDDNFGYYTCVIVHDDLSISVVRWGLNIDGADFSELMDTYRENAIIGGIAAAGMLVLVGGACLIWNFRYANRRGDDDIIRGGAVTVVGQTRDYDNAGFKSDVTSGIEMAEVEVRVEGAEGKS